MEAGEEAEATPVKGTYGWSDAIVLAAIPVMAFIIVALFRLGACHFLRSPNDWTSASPIDVLDVFRDIVLLVWTSLFDMRWVVYYPGLFLSVIGLATALRRDMKGVDDMTCMGAIVAFFASFKLSPIVCFGIVYLFVTHGDRIRPFLSGDASAKAFSKPSMRLLAGILLILTPFYYLGYMNAYGRTDYYVSANAPKYALLQTYNDYIIAAPASMSYDAKSFATLNIASGVKTFKLGAPETPEFDRLEVHDVTVDGSRVWSPLLWVCIP